MSYLIIRDKYGNLTKEFELPEYIAKLEFDEVYDLVRQCHYFYDLPKEQVEVVPELTEEILTQIKIKNKLLDITVRERV